MFNIWKFNKTHEEPLYLKLQNFAVRNFEKTQIFEKIHHGHGLEESILLRYILCKFIYGFSAVLFMFPQSF